MGSGAFTPLKNIGNLPSNRSTCFKLQQHLTLLPSVCLSVCFTDYVLSLLAYNIFQILILRNVSIQIEAINAPQKFQNVNTVKIVKYSF